MEVNLLDKMLAAFQEQRVPVTIVLLNKTRVSGRVRAFDNYIILLENAKHEMVYRHAVSSLAPASAAQQPRTVRQQSERPKQTVTAEKRTSSAARRPHTPRPAAKAPSAEDPGINSGMKEGLLRWMQEHKASK